MFPIIFAMTPIDRLSYRIIMFHQFYKNFFHLSDISYMTGAF